MQWNTQKGLEHPSSDFGQQETAPTGSTSAKQWLRLSSNANPKCDLRTAGAEFGVPDVDGLPAEIPQQEEVIHDAGPVRIADTLPEVNEHDKPEISTQVRHAMRSVPQPVVLITSTDMSTGSPIYRGATISSFNTVTLEPEPIVSLNIKRPSSTFDAIQSSGYFAVHLLRASLAASKLATAFTKGSSGSPFNDLGPNFDIARRKIGAKKSPPALRSAHVPFRLGCAYRHDKTVELGDHVVIFGTVWHVYIGNVKGSDDTAAQTDEPCLLYAGGQYGRVCELDTADGKVRESALPPMPTADSQGSGIGNSEVVRKLFQGNDNGEVARKVIQGELFGKITIQPVRPKVRFTSKVPVTTINHKNGSGSVVRPVPVDQALISKHAIDSIPKREVAVDPPDPRKREERSIQEALEDIHSLLRGGDSSTSSPSAPYVGGRK